MVSVLRVTARGIAAGTVFGCRAASPPPFDDTNMPILSYVHNEQEREISSN